MNRRNELFAAILTLVMIIAAGLQVIIALAAGAPMLIATGILTTLLALPVLQNTARSPQVTLENDGLSIHTSLWGTHKVPFAAISAIREDPSLPPAGAEIYRQKAVGKANYRPVEGKILVASGLPLPYRVVGFFAGEGLNAVIAINSRSVSNYARLMPLIEQRWQQATAR
ncbi:MAG: hypothetical protein UZ15_CFX003000665 [Chloroflexi bacterium OLB15]|nr:MAG: hypothetical protein UZ15_CFX003000665 [Chloroflexi bacterium OLB15]